MKNAQYVKSYVVKVLKKEKVSQQSSKAISRCVNTLTRSQEFCLRLCRYLLKPYLAISSFMKSFIFHAIL